MAKFRNTYLLSPAANFFKKNGYYTAEPNGTKAWLDYWNLQKERCLNGYEAGGIKITGEHYWYLNFSRINLIPKDAQSSKKRNVRKIEDFPHFWDSDYDWFWCQYIARNGITKKEYNQLGLSVDIHPDYIECGGLHIVCLKSRRKGYSFKAGASLALDFHLIPRAKNYAFAFDDDYLVDDALLDKVWMNIYFNNKNCAWGQPLLNDRASFKKAGYETVKDGVNVEDGYLSQVQGIAFQYNADKSRGKDANKIKWEEAGKFPNILKSWEIARNTSGQGDFVTGQMTAFGTGGSGGEDMIGLDELFRKPETYGCLPIRNKWEKGLENTYCGFFVSVVDNMEGFMDKDGNSNREGALQRVKDKREKARRKSQEAYIQAVAEEPLDPAEALMETNTNIFPISDLAAQKARIKANAYLENLGVPGKLVRKDGTVKFTVDTDLFPVNHYPHKPTEDLSGAIVIYEKPVKIQGVVPKDLYFIAVDPYAFDSSSDQTSVGACYVFKRSNNFSATFNDLPVASYIGRPKLQAQFNQRIFMLAELYNCKIGFENDRGDIISYARENKKLHMLEREFEFDYKKELQSKTVNRGYGMHTTSGRKEQGIIYIRDWLLEVVAKDQHENDIYRFEQIYDIGLLEELIHYKDKGNFDRVSALIVAMFYSKEMISLNKKVKQNTSDSKRSFFKEVYNGTAR